MTIPKSLKIHECSKCKAPLPDGAFARCGVSLNSEPRCAFFDYDCPACGFSGRYLMPCKAPPTAALSSLANLLEAGDKQRETAHFDLSRIHGVEDILKLGGNNAPREKLGKDLDFGCRQ